MFPDFLVPKLESLEDKNKKIECPTKSHKLVRVSF